MGISLVMIQSKVILFVLVHHFSTAPILLKVTIKNVEKEVLVIANKNMFFQLVFASLVRKLFPAGLVQGLIMVKFLIHIKT